MNEGICPITQSPFRHPITIVDSDRMKISVELREYYRFVKKYARNATHPISGKLIVTASYNETLKHNVDGLALTDDRYPDYDRTPYQPFINYLNLNGANSHLYNLFAYYVRSNLEKKGLRVLQTAAFATSAAASLNSALASNNAKNIADKVYYSIGCGLAKSGAMPLISNMSLFFPPGFSAQLTATFKIAFLILVFKTGELHGHSAKGNVLHQGALGGLLLLSIYANSTHFADSTTVRAYEDCSHNQPVNLLSIEQYNTELSRNLNHQHLIIGVLALVLYSAGFLSGYLNRQFTAGENDAFNIVDGEDGSSDRHPLRP